MFKKKIIANYNSVMWQFFLCKHNFLLNIYLHIKNIKIENSMSGVSEKENYVYIKRFGFEHLFM